MYITLACNGKCRWHVNSTVKSYIKYTMSVYYQLVFKSRGMPLGLWLCVLVRMCLGGFIGSTFNNINNPSSYIPIHVSTDIDIVSCISDEPRLSMFS